MKNDNISVWALLEQAYLKNPNNEVLYDGTTRMTYNELFQKAQGMAAGLSQKGIEKGDRVLLCLSNWHEFVVIQFALAQLGAVAVPCHPKTRKEKLQYMIAETEAKAIFITEEHRHLDFIKSVLNGPSFLEHIITVRFNDHECFSYDELLHVGKNTIVPEVLIEPTQDIFAIMYTAEPTGKLKGVMVTHSNFVYAATVSVDHFEGTSHDVFLVTDPIFYCFGIAQILSAIAVAGKLVFMEEFDEETACKFIEQEKVTIFHGEATQYRAIINHNLAHQYDLSTLQSCLITVSSDTIKSIQQISPELDCELVVAYGKPETTTMVTRASFTEGNIAQRANVGKVVSGVEVKIVDQKREEVAQGVVGEIAVKSFGITKGYFKQLDETTEVINENGWFYSSDLGMIDENDNLILMGHKKDSIRHGGSHVYPREMELLLHKHESVLEAAIVEISDPTLGEITCAAIKLKPNKIEDRNSIRAYISEMVANEQVPDHYIFLDKLPITASGKIKKVALQHELKEKLKPILC